MNRTISNIFNIILLGIIFSFFYFSNNIYNDYYINNLKKFTGIFENLPYILLLAGIFIAAHFNKSKIVFLNIFLGGMYYYVLNNRISTVGFFIIYIFININFLLFKIFKERGIFTFFGILKFILLGSEFYGLNYILKNYSNEILQYMQNFKYLPFTEVKYDFILISVVLTVLNIVIFNLIFRVYENFFSKCFSICNIIFLSGFILLMYRISVKDTKFFILMSVFNFQTLISIITLYLSTWDRVFTDELTGLLNRRALDESLPKLGKTYSVTMMDIDHFKNFNDTYGHQAGDDVLKFVADVLKSTNFGKQYRYGGEEFTVLSPGKTHEDIFNHVDNFRRDLAGQSMVLTRAKKDSQVGKKVSVTVSLGIATATEYRQDPREVIKTADSALYRAKKNGRNRVEVERRKQNRKKK